jgi:putative effector of murein hydrolase
LLKRLFWLLVGTVLGTVIGAGAATLLIASRALRHSLAVRSARRAGALAAGLGRRLAAARAA